MTRKNLLHFLFLRTALAFLSYSWHNADETWQSVEVAHKIVFGRGYLTWEWTNDVVGPIRSYIHPMIFVPILYLLKLTRLDFHWMVVLAPRIQQGIISAFADYYVMKFHDFNFGKSSQKWFIILYSSNVYLLYCGSRTLVNTLEMNLTCFALYNYSKAISEHIRNESLKSARRIFEGTAFNCLRENVWINEMVYVIIISISFVIRPTTAIFWIPLVLYHIFLLTKQRTIISTLVCKLVPCASLMLMISIGLDSMMHEKIVFIPWNFFKINFMQKVGSQYGVEPWNYYLTHTILPLLNISSVLIVGGIRQSSKQNRSSRIYLLSTLWTITLLSTLAHKEQRFLLPVFPLLLCYGADYLQRLELREKYKKMIAAIIIISNLFPLSYLLFAHKVGQTNVVHYLAQDFETSKGDEFYHTNILFLLPCHSTPYYSHFHLNYPLDFLECNPVLDNNWKAYSEGKDESDFFFENPNEWIKKELLASSEEGKLPSHIVIYDTQASLTIFKHFASKYNFIECMDIFNAFFPENKKVGKRILVYCKKVK